jgi:PAS domain S-box-containing protein
MNADLQGARLLIVDDDALLRGMTVKTLRHAGFEVHEAECGASALDLFEHNTFELLLLDVMMPGIDGYEVCRRVRMTPAGAQLPILMLTGLNDTESIRLAYDAGATDFIQKPINWTLLSHRVMYAMRAGAAASSATQSRDRLERAQRIANMGSWQIASADDGFVCSPELARIFGAPADGLAGASPASFLARVCEADRQSVAQARRAAQQRAEAYQLTFRVERFDGELRTVFEQAGPALDRHGRQIGIEGITQDITERVDAERRIRHLAHHDLLTGLPNRQFFTELAAPALQRSRRLGAHCALLHVDLDRFKQVNDAYGHAEGDAVLRTVAERLQASIRAADLASTASGAPGTPHDAVVARVGANAFTLLLLDIGNDQQAATVAKRLLSTVAVPMTVRGSELVLTASIGIALFPRDAADAPGMARCAEQAAYSAKGAGRATYGFFDEAINLRASARLAREADLRRAIAEGELRLHYQPKVDAGTGRILGAEALVRWQHPENGLVPPVQFIALAEESGLILPLTDWVLETACADVRRRADAGLRAVPVSVNLAAPSFADAGLPAQLHALLAKHALEPACLTLEVTESLLMSDVDAAVTRLRDLRASGFSVSLDDFGTGFSSLSYLQRFPVDELKIDRSFVTDVCRGGRDGAIAASIIALGREFGLRVVAEGVETAGQAEFLLAHGCNQQQGYLFARPMPGAAFDALLAGGHVARQ